MMDMLVIARKRQEELEQLLRKIEEKSKGAASPQGKLVIKQHRDGVQYYVRHGGREAKDKYLRKEQEAVAFQIAQKDYDQRMEYAARKELASIQRMLRQIPAVRVEEVFTHLSKERRKMISPYLIPDEEYIRDWEDVSYEHKGFPEDYPEYYTARQERVRSKSEILIADMLGRMGIPYRYEYPLILEGLRIHPDFTALHVTQRRNVIWEHLGMMDSLEYVQSALSRMEEYEKAGYVIGRDLILTWETNRKPLSTVRIRENIERYLL